MSIELFSGLLILLSSVLFLVAVISLPPCFSMSSRTVFDASTLSSVLASPLPLSFLDMYNLSTSFQGCKALCMVISFLVLWPICLRSSLVHFKNGFEYLRKGTAKVFTPLIRYLLYNFVSSSFLVLLRYTFSLFSFISSLLMVSAPNIPK